MDSSTAFAACEAAVRKHDPDRYFSALFAPAATRPLMFALYAFNHELARIGEVVREPMMGEIRLQWWRETLESARHGQPRAHDVARALAESFARVALPAALFEAMIDARALDSAVEAFPDDAARDAYLDATSGNLMRLAARALGSGSKDDELAREAGIAYGLTGLIRSQNLHRTRGKTFLRDVESAAKAAREHLARAKHLPKPEGALPAFLPAALVPLYLKDTRKEVPLYRKQIALLGAALHGQV
ncbi:MAG TPA: squalene/phytoene synthase family protein [Rhizomicrobium sp.]|nr:squalene/phytoene synthase family protein [Rhizomicrobium sp.]